MCLIDFNWKLDSKLKLLERIWGLGWFVFLLWGFAFPSGLYLAIQNNLNWILKIWNDLRGQGWYISQQSICFPIQGSNLDHEDLPGSEL